MPRKTDARYVSLNPTREASMRPRPDAAENPLPDRMGDRTGRASMRPRPDAAENDRSATYGYAVGDCFNEAAARCRGKLPARAQTGLLLLGASMRPRPDAAENIRPSSKLPASSGLQ